MTTLTASLHHPPAGACRFRRRPLSPWCLRRPMRCRRLLLNHTAECSGGDQFSMMDVSSPFNHAAPFIPRRSYGPIKSP